ncbi:glycosyl transferase [soil metagenome]
MATSFNMLLEKAAIARRLASAYYQVMRYPTARNQSRHGLPHKVVISLTSYPPRFGTLHLTLRSLLDQQVTPDEVQLWIAFEDQDSIPAKVKSLEADGLKILYCDNLKSYKKIIPSLQLNPEAYIITVDDDCYYPKDLVKVLTEEFDPKFPTINTRRPNQITRFENGQIKPYLQWNGNIAGDTPADAPQSDLFATGHGGVLYFPGCFDPEVMNIEAFTRICPNADDVWLYWMARKAGTMYRKVGGRFVSANWRGSQAESLMAANVASSGNDQQILQMVEHYGLV